MILVSIIVPLFFGVVSMNVMDSENVLRHYKSWNMHKSKYNLKFEQEQESLRFEQFIINSKRINEINARNLTYTCKMNKFGHWTDDEYLNHLSFQVQEKDFPKEEQIQKDTFNNEIPDIDWRAKGFVSPVKDQGSCGSCWAFSAIEVMESKFVMKTGHNISLSAQQLVDCSTSFNNNGCNGGLPLSAFMYALTEGINLEEDYPYEAIDSKCRIKTEKLRIGVSKVKDLNKGVKVLQNAIHDDGPISIALDASGTGFRFYDHGVYTGDDCSWDRYTINHAVLAVGLGSTPNKHYIVKNSWGDEYGDNGFILMARDMGHICGIGYISSSVDIKIVNQ